MQSRRDQLQAYRFLTRRAVAALVTGQPDIPEPPMRRLTLTTFAGLMIAVLVAAVFGLYGIVRPGTTDKWKHDGAVVIERETGAQYAYYNGELHPALNFASAVLATGSKKPPSRYEVARSKLVGVPRSPMIGINGLPNSLPAKSGLVRAPWTVCSQIVQQATDNNLAKVTLTVGSAAGSTRLPADDGVIVTTPGTGGNYLLWHGQRLRVASTDIAVSLGMSSGQALTVGSAFLNALPQGPAFQTPTIADAGRPATQHVDGKAALVGQLLHITDQQKYAVLLADGVHDLSPVQAALVRTEVLAGQRRDPIDTTETTELGLPQSSAGWAQLSAQFAGLPQQIPLLDSSSAQHGGVCALFGDGTQAPVLAASNATPPVGGTVTESDRSRHGLADSVTVESGRAAIVRSAGGSPTEFIVAEPGQKFPIAAPASDVLSAFGYAGVDPVRLPDQLLLMLPTGPALSPAAARQTVS